MRLCQSESEFSHGSCDTLQKQSLREAGLRNTTVIYAFVAQMGPFLFSFSSALSLCNHFLIHRAPFFHLFDNGPHGFADVT